MVKGALGLIVIALLGLVIYGFFVLVNRTKPPKRKQITNIFKKKSKNKNKK